ncbi:MAG: class I SAM-dependent methyltransferase [Acidobacteria bacterium]|nr:class I SAM-dependent methyltransferase [Acidobacteriota bacterium]
MHHTPSLFAAILAAALLPILPAQTRTPTPSQVSAPTAQHPTSTPYTGDLSVFESKDRADKLQIDRVMTLLNLKPGSVVADIGAGGGWFTVRAAKRVADGPDGGGKVIAEDINPKAIVAIRQRAQREHLPNIQPILGTPDNPNLPPNSLDAALMLEVYHEIANPQPFLAHLRSALKPGARFGIIDRNGTGADHGLNEPILRSEIEHAGFKQVGRYDFTKAAGQDYFLIFQKQ